MDQLSVDSRGGVSMSPRIVTARSMKLCFRTGQLRTMGPEKSVVGHYSAGPRASDLEEGIARAKQFHQWHLDKGWAGIGYHFLIPDDGSIIGCRPTLYDGAHVAQNNHGRIGVNMPGTVGDRPTRRQARAFWWLLHNAHTKAMPSAHRTDRNLSRLPRYGHKDLGATACPGLFYGMYLKGGEPWVAKATRRAPREGFCEPTPEDRPLLEALEHGLEIDPAAELAATAPDDDELRVVAATLELPEADDEFDEDLEELLAEIAAAELQPLA
jgi:hypothetical protein